MEPNSRKKEYYTLAQAESFEITRSPGLIDLIKAIARILFRRPSRRRVHTPALLTRREWQVLELVGRGYTNREIAAELVIAPETVKTHIANLRAKLQLASKNELRYWFIEHSRASE